MHFFLRQKDDRNFFFKRMVKFFKKKEKGGISPLSKNILNIRPRR